MLLLEECVSHVIATEGQLLIPLQSLRLDYDQLERIFVMTAKQLQNKRPIRANIQLDVGVDGVKIPDALGVLALKYRLYNNFDRVSPPISRQYWSFDKNTRILRNIFASTLIVSYLREFKLGHFLIQDTPTYIVPGESIIDFYLKGSYKHNTLKISKGSSEMVEVSRTGTTANLSGTLGTGTVNLTTLKVNLNLTDTSEGDLNVQFWNKHKACPDLDLSNRPFMLMFTVNFLKSFGALKYQATLNENAGLPFSLQADSLLERARALEDQLTPLLNSNDHWYEFGF